MKNFIINRPFQGIPSNPLQSALHTLNLDQVADCRAPREAQRKQWVKGL